MELIVILLLVIIFLISPVAALWIIGIIFFLWLLAYLLGGHSQADQSNIAEADKVNAPVDKVLFGVDFSKGFARLWPIWLSFFIFFMIFAWSYLENM